jgi:hypothetical protein
LPPEVSAHAAIASRSAGSADGWSPGFQIDIASLQNGRRLAQRKGKGRRTEYGDGRASEKDRLSCVSLSL